MLASPEVRLEAHLTITEISNLWNVSDDTARRIFEDEPGVLVIGEPSRLVGGRTRKYKRRYKILRIPRAVFARVEQRLMNKRNPNSDSVLAVGGARSYGRDLHAS
jgi:hypothetical protein